jgi:hypothetical protein
VRLPPHGKREPEVWKLEPEGRPVGLQRSRWHLQALIYEPEMRQSKVAEVLGVTRQVVSLWPFSVADGLQADRRGQGCRQGRLA